MPRDSDRVYYRAVTTAERRIIYAIVAVVTMLALVYAAGNRDAIEFALAHNPF